MIALAKQHPIATTYERPRTADALPVAPARIPDEPAPAAPPADAQAAPASRDQVIIVGNDPAPQTPPAAAYRWPDTSYPGGASYNGYNGYVDSSPYVWSDGAWVSRPGVGAYVGTPWIGVGVGRPWGYGWGYGYNYGYPRAWGAPAPYYRRPPVLIQPSRPTRYYDRPTTRSWGYQSSPRREVYVAPRAAPYRAPSVSRPAYRAPAAAPRSSGPVYRAPASAPRSSGGGGGGRRSVHVR
jgi:hypothetical protein